MEAKSHHWKDRLLFYVTAFFLLLATFSLFAFLFLVPFFIEPALATIKMDFDTSPALCVSVHSESLRGLTNCSWSSCREGCTKEVFDCTQVRVKYLTKENYWIYGGKLQPNVKGCGYPPEVDCHQFVQKYAAIGANYSCYYSLIDPTLVITHLDIEQVRSELVYCLAVPIVSFAVSVFYLIFAYFRIYVELPPPPTVCAVDSEATCDKEETDSGVIASPLGFPGKTGRQSDDSPIMRRPSSVERQFGMKKGDMETEFSLPKLNGDSTKTMTIPISTVPGLMDSLYDVHFKDSLTSRGDLNKYYQNFQSALTPPG